MEQSNAFSKQQLDLINTVIKPYGKDLFEMAAEMNKRLEGSGVCVGQIVIGVDRDKYYNKEDMGLVGMCNIDIDDDFPPSVVNQLDWYDFEGWSKDNGN